LGGYSREGELCLEGFDSGELAVDFGAMKDPLERVWSPRLGVSGGTVRDCRVRVTNSRRFAVP